MARPMLSRPALASRFRWREALAAPPLLRRPPSGPRSWSPRWAPAASPELCERCLPRAAAARLAAAAGLLTGALLAARASRNASVLCDTGAASEAASHDAPLAPSLTWLQAANEVACGPKLAAFLAAVAQTGLPTDEAAEASPGEAACWEAALDLVRFADFAGTALVAQREAHDGEDVEPLGVMAAWLHGRFVSAAVAAGHVPSSWSSACRNMISGAYAFPLLSDSEIKTVALELGRRGVFRILDPLAGTGLHARLLREAGLEVEASDALPAARCPGGCGWFRVEPRTLELVDWKAWADHDAALLLSWPPRWSAAGEQALASFRGSFVVFIGDRGQWTGSSAFHAVLAEEWTEVWRREVLRWPHMQDDVRIFERRRWPA
uniref:Uncharacterized protein n=2 Tax=Alexandrium monilatum TaxID=311494 RepID=A0A7S4W2X8_9DINO